MAKLPTAKQISKGLSIYRVANSPYWMVRVRDRKGKRYVVKSTKERSAIAAREVAQEMAIDLLAGQPIVPSEFAFKTFAKKFLHKSRLQGEAGELNANYVKTMHWAITNADWGLYEYFQEEDVREIWTHHWNTYLTWLTTKRPDLSPSTKNTLTATFRNVMKIAQDEGVIRDVPKTPRTKLKDNPRPFFRFHPLVEPEDDLYQKLRRTAQEMAAEEVVVRGVPLTLEMYDIILFLAHSFVRPTTSELYALTHRNVKVQDDPRRLDLTIVDGKTGFREASTMPAAVSAYERICERYPDASKDDYLFFPQYSNRTTVRDIVKRQFKEVLKRADLLKDPVTGKDFALYSLRHTAICMRVINGGGQVDIYNLAKNAGTSVDQIERFYTKYLPVSKEMAQNLQVFGR